MIDFIDWWFLCGSVTFILLMIFAYKTKQITRKDFTVGFAVCLITGPLLLFLYMITEFLFILQRSKYE